MFQVSDGYTLLAAVRMGNYDVCVLILEKGADVNITDEDGESPLLEAARHGRHKICDLLLKKGADVNIRENKDGESPLLVAARNGHYDVCVLLLKKEADVNITNIDGESPLYLAARQGHHKICDLLLKKGADVNIRHNKDGNSPLLVAARNGRFDVCVLLLKTEADVNITNIDGESPLYLAARQGHHKICDLLLNNGADFNIRENKNDWSPFDVAARNNNKKICEMILKWQNMPRGIVNLLPLLPKFQFILEEDEFKDWLSPVHPKVTASIEALLQNASSHVLQPKNEVSLRFTDSSFVTADQDLDQKLLFESQPKLIFYDLFETVDMDVSIKYGRLKLPIRIKPMILPSSKTDIDSKIGIDIVRLKTLEEIKDTLWQCIKKVSLWDCCDEVVCLIALGDAVYPITLKHKSSSLQERMVLERNRLFDKSIKANPFVRDMLFWYSNNLPLKKILDPKFMEESKQLFDTLYYLGFKIVILGQTGAGKTRLRRELQKMDYIPDRDLRTSVFEWDIINFDLFGIEQLQSNGVNLIGEYWSTSQENQHSQNSQLSRHSNEMKSNEMKAISQEENVEINLAGSKTIDATAEEKHTLSPKIESQHEETPFIPIHIFDFGGERQYLQTQRNVIEKINFTEANTLVIIVVNGQHLAKAKTKEDRIKLLCSEVDKSISRYPFTAKNMAVLITYKNRLVGDPTTIKPEKLDANGSKLVESHERTYPENGEMLNVKIGNESSQLPIFLVDFQSSEHNPIDAVQSHIQKICGGYTAELVIQQKHDAVNTLCEKLNNGNCITYQASDEIKKCFNMFSMNHPDECIFFTNQWYFYYLKFCSGPNNFLSQRLERLQKGIDWLERLITMIPFVSFESVHDYVTYSISFLESGARQDDDSLQKVVDKFPESLFARSVMWLQGILAEKPKDTVIKELTRSRDDVSAWFNNIIINFPIFSKFSHELNVSITSDQIIDLESSNFKCDSMTMNCVKKELEAIRYFKLVVDLSSPTVQTVVFDWLGRIPFALIPIEMLSSPVKKSAKAAFTKNFIWKLKQLQVILDEIQMIENVYCGQYPKGNKILYPIENIIQFLDCLKAWRRILSQWNDPQILQNVVSNKDKFSVFIKQVFRNPDFNNATFQKCSYEIFKQVYDTDTIVSNKETPRTAVDEPIPKYNISDKLTMFESKLESGLQKKHLCELHTHLMGMGSADFWLEKVICFFVPHMVKRHQPNSIENIYDCIIERETTFKDYALNRKKRKNELNNKLGRVLNAEEPQTRLTESELDYKMSVMLEDGLITIDVVYDVDTLLKAFFGFDKKAEDTKYIMHLSDRIRRLESMLSNPHKHCLFKKALRKYIYYDFKTNDFVEQLGVTNSYLLDVMEWDSRNSERSERAKSIISRLRNCFSMLNPDGSSSSTADLDNYRGNFTPCFYPMRYAMKDPLYQQYPIVLSYLLNYVCNRYYKAGVSYVEFSIGVNDASNEIISKFIDPEYTIYGKLTDDENDNRALAIGWSSLPKTFLYKFLIAFPRTTTVVAPLSKAARRRYVILFGPQYISSPGFIDPFLSNLFSPLTFESWLTKLNNILKKPSANLFVGFDLVGEEDGNPFSPFLHSEFKKIISRFQEHNKRFGIRFHAGENVVRGSSVDVVESCSEEFQLNFAVHMEVIKFEIMALKDILKVPDNEKGYNIRIGHGLAFVLEHLACEDHLSALKKIEKLFGEECPDVLRQFKEVFHLHDGKSWHAIRSDSTFFQWLIDNKIVFEVNLTSNETLLHDVFTVEVGSTKRCNFLMEMLAKGLYVRLSTDDDGIWPIHECARHKYHISVAHEYCKALRTVYMESYGRFNKYCQEINQDIKKINKAATYEYLEEDELTFGIRSLSRYQQDHKKETAKLLDSLFRCFDSDELQHGWFFESARSGRRRANSW